MSSEVSRSDVLQSMLTSGGAVLGANVFGQFLLHARAGDAPFLDPKAQDAFTEVPSIMYDVGLAGTVFLGLLGMILAGFSLHLAVEYWLQRGDAQ